MSRVDYSVRYEMLEKVGTGSFATVYRARDRQLNREVAIKQIHEQYRADPHLLDRYWQEARLLASLQHPNIVTIFDVVHERGWLVMELMHASLARLTQQRQMDLRSLRSTLAHGLRALRYLHERGIIHGDIKPGNMMIDARRRVKIGDFGLARRVSNEDGSLLKGTTKYMAPEVVSDEFGEVGPASDLYSLGFSAYELMCGPTFMDLFPGMTAFGRDQQVAWMMWHAAPDRRLPEISRVLEGVPEDVAFVIQKLTTKDQSKRYHRAEGALSDLNIDLKIVKTGGGDVDDDDGEPREPINVRRLVAVCAFCASLFLCAVLLFWDPATSSRGMAPDIALVTAVDAKQNMVRIEDVDEGLPEILTLGKRPRIRLRDEDRYLLVQELLPGDRVEIERSNGEVVQLTVDRPVATTGRLARIDPRARRLEVAVDSGGRNTVLAIDMADRAEVQLNGARAELDDLREGDAVELTHLSAIGKTGHRVSRTIRAQRKEDPVAERRPESAAEPATDAPSESVATEQSAASATAPATADADGSPAQEGAPAGTTPDKLAPVENAGPPPSP